MNSLWFIFGLSLATLVAVNSLRINLGFITLPIPLLVLGLIMLLSILTNRETVIERKHFGLIIISISLALWSFISVVANFHNYGIMSQYQTGLEEAVKLTISIGAFICILFSYDKNFIKNERVWVAAIWSSSLLLTYYIYMSLSNGNLFLTTNTSDMSIKLGRNVTGWFAAMVFPFALANLYFSPNIKMKIINTIPLAIISLAVVYSISRMAWLMSVLSIIIMILSIGKISIARAVKISLGLLIILAIGLTFIATTLQNYIDLSEITSKLMWFLSPRTGITSDAGITYDSFNNRFFRIFDGLTVFFHYPIFGVGPGNFVFHPLSTGGQVHNDYVLSLAETGLGGLILISLLIFALLFCSKIRRIESHSQGFYWPGVASRAALVILFFSMIFMDTYRTPQVWIFFGLFICTITTERNINEKNNQKHSVIE